MTIYRSDKKSTSIDIKPPSIDNVGEIPKQ
jgi:hypothetical protein